MQIELNLYASLMKYMPQESGRRSSAALEVSEGTTIEVLLESLKIPRDTIKLIFLNGIHAKGEEVLQEGDRVGVFPPVAGG